MEEHGFSAYDFRSEEMVDDLGGYSKKNWSKKTVKTDSF